MKSFSKFLAFAWLFSAGINLIAYFTVGFDFDKLLIAMLEIFLAHYNWEDYKRGE